MIFFLIPLPIFVIWFDLLYAFGQQLNYRLNLTQKPSTPSDLPINPELALNWLQIISNGLILLIISICLLVCLNLYRRTLKKNASHLTFFQAIALTSLFLFSLPSLWALFYFVIKLPHSLALVEYQARALIVGLCMVYLCIFIVLLYYKHRQLKHQTAHQTPDPDPHNP